MAHSKGRQIAKQTKRQIGFTIGQNILQQISNLANGVRDAIHKGRVVDTRNGQPVQMGCTPADVKRSLSPEQEAGVEEFIASWATEPESPPQQPKPVSPPKRPRTQKKPV